MKIKTISVEFNRDEVLTLINFINKYIYQANKEMTPRECIKLSDISAKMCKAMHELNK